MCLDSRSFRFLRKGDASAIVRIDRLRDGTARKVVLRHQIVRGRPQVRRPGIEGDLPGSKVNRERLRLAGVGRGVDLYRFRRLVAQIEITGSVDRKSPGLLVELAQERRRLGGARWKFIDGR